MTSLFNHHPQKPMLALRLFVANHGTSVIRFSNTTCRLTDESGATIPVISQGEVNARLYDSGSGTAGVIIILTLGYGAPIAAGVMGASEADNHHDQAVTRSQSMDLLLLDPGKAFAGFVFFDDAASGVLRRSGATHLTLHIERMMRGDGIKETPLTFDIPFSVDR